MSAHSPEPWTYDAEREVVCDANKEIVCDFEGYGRDDAQAHANGHRIAALSAENERLLQLLSAASMAMESADYKDTENAVDALSVRQRIQEHLERLGRIR